MMYYFGNSWGMPHFYGMGFGFFGIVFWVIIFYIFIKIIRNDNSRNIPKDHGDPIKILKARYAKGEINKEQFESIKKEIE